MYKASRKYIKDLEKSKYKLLVLNQDFVLRTILSLCK